jgi:hypothetical protein
MSESSRNLLTIGVFILTIVVAIVLYLVNLIGLVSIVSVVLVLFGVWLLALGAMRSSKPVKYERSPFSTMALGLCAIAFGGAVFLFSYNWLYSLIVVLLVAAGLVIAAALKRK